MSVCVNAVISTEEMKRGDRVEMMVEIDESADTVRGYNPNPQTEDAGTKRNVQTHHTGKDTAWSRCYRLTAVCVVLLCVLLLTAVTVLWNKFNNLKTENNQLQTSNNNMTIERVQLQTSYNNLTIERDQLQMERDGYLRMLCDLYKGKWFSFNSTLYFMTNESKNWTESRQDCRDKGGDLVIINSKEEQDFIGKQLDSSRVWIGLSDRDTEGEWKWVNGTPLKTTFWNEGEPNNAGDEDCAESFTIKNGNVWNDAICSYKRHGICEKPFLKTFNSVYVKVHNECI